MTELVETFRGVVYPQHHDHMGHMNVQWYTAFFDQGTWSLFARIGITAAYMREHHRGMAAVRNVTEYKQEAVAGDLLIIKSRFTGVGTSSIEFAHVMYNDLTGDELATANLKGVHIDTQKRASTPLPEEIRAKVRGLIEGA